MSRPQHDSPSPSASPSPHSVSRPSSSGNSDHSKPGPTHGPTPVSERQSTSSPQSPQGVSSSSEGYPSWLPKRPPGPAPRSTIHSVAGMFSDPGPSNSNEPEPPATIGRKPTPRSVRIVSLQSQAEGATRREPTDQSRAFSGAGHARAWSRATSAALTPTLFSASGGGEAQPPRPRFNAPALNLELLRNPSWKMRLSYYLFPLFVFGHIPLQTFFDFNAVFILLSVAKFPNPEAPGVPGSGRNWALGAAAYIACWFAWIAVVFVVYELVYSFIRRWRVKRPLILPIYFSSAAFNFAAMSSYVNFSFIYHIRFSAFAGEHGSLSDGLAETFYLYSQNLPTVALLMPRAALCLALLFAFTSPDPNVLTLADAGLSRRDGTFFRADGTLTDYARGVLVANAAWTAWRMLVLLISWAGLWVLSGQGCAGLCGPRYRWEEEDAEKAAAALHDNVSDLDTLPWSWKECTILRVKEAYDFCLTNKPSALGKEKDMGKGPGKETPQPAAPLEGLERIFAAVGLPSTPQAARRGILSEELFESPRHTPELEHKDADKAAGAVPELSSIIPPVSAVLQKERTGADPSGPLMSLPYPFTGYGAQVSSEDVVPFPPSPGMEDKDIATEGEETHRTGEEDEDGEGEEEEEEEDEEEEDESEVPSSERRTSGSMSSLGRPVVSRYPFQFRRPRGSISSASHMSPQTHSTPHSTQSQSTQSRSTRHSRSTQSTGNVESSDSHSHSPRSNTSSNASPHHSSFSGSIIPMPPRHPQAQAGGQRRARAGTVPIPIPPASPSSPSPVVFPGGRPRARTRTESMLTDPSATFGPIPIGSFEFDGEDDDDDDHVYEHDLNDESIIEVPEAEGSIEEAERQDSVGLLSAAPSPRASLANLRHRASGLSHRRSNGSRSGSGASAPHSHSHSRSRTNSNSNSNSRSRTNSGTSLSDAARSRAQSLIQSLGAASRSSLELVLVRSRANSLVRLPDSDSPSGYASASTSSEAVLSSPENHTFGHPLREQWRAEEGLHEMEDIAEAGAEANVPLPSSSSSSGEGDEGMGEETGMEEMHTTRSALSQQSEVSLATERGGMPIARAQAVAIESRPDLSTAPQSFITTPTTREDTTSSSGRTQRTWGTMDHYPQADWQPR